MTRPFSSSLHSAKPDLASHRAQEEFDREIRHRLEAAERNDLHDDEAVFDEVDRLIQDSNKTHS